MSEYITQIPNLEKGKVYTINVCDPESAVNAVKELVYRLCGTIIRRMEGLYNRRFVRAFIIDGSDKLKVLGSDGKLKDNPSNVAIRLDSFASKKKVPVIAIVIK